MKNLQKIALVFGLMMFGFMATGTVENLFTDSGVAHAAVFEKNINSDEAVTGGGESANIIAKIFSFANVFAGIVLAVSIVMIILGGLRYITANGDPKSAEQGKMVLLYSGIGVLIALSAFALGRFFQSFAVDGSGS